MMQVNPSEAGAVQGNWLPARTPQLVELEQEGTNEGGGRDTRGVGKGFRTERGLAFIELILLKANRQCV